jgi:glucose/arabinose dehydrogenase
MAFFPDGRIIIGQKNGVLLLIKNGSVLPTPFIDISDHVNDVYDRGFLSVAVDSAFPAQPYAYLYYTYENDPSDLVGTKTVRLTRVTVTGDTADPASETVLLGTSVGKTCHDFPAGADCVPSDGFSHSAGNVRSAPDGTLFVTVGDGADFNTVTPDALRSQDVDSLSGKLLHITRDGQGLSSNPFWTGNPNDNRSKVWAMGLRNSYRFNLRPGSSPYVPYVGDVGWATWEELNVIPAGSNMGWPCYEGSAQQDGYAPYQVCQDLYAGHPAPFPPPPAGSGSLKSIGIPIGAVAAPHGSTTLIGRINDGDSPPVGTNDPSRQYDSWDGANTATEDWVGYQFAGPQTFAKVVFQEGMHFADGGWFASGPTVQVRQNGQWVGVAGLAVNPAYPGNNGVNFETFTYTFTAIQGDAIRIDGVPGGSAAFISVGELDVFALVDGGGAPPPPPVSTPPPLASPPMVQWSHDGLSSAVTAGLFYTGTIYPAPYQGAYFFGDYAESWLRTLRVDANNALVTGSITDFAQDVGGPVYIELGPDGLIYYVAISTAEIRRIKYSAGGNTPPVAVAAATPSSGLAPLAVQFSSAGSNDPDGDPLTFAWDFGDGTSGTGPSPQHTYQGPSGTRVATLTVSDNHGGATTATVPITVGNRPPVATIASPATTFKYKVGDVVSYSGSATDPDQGSLPASALSWQIIIHHCPGGDCHTHPFLTGTGASGTFTVPDHGDDSYMELILTATDSGGLTNTVSQVIQPQTLQVTLATAPPGLQVTYDGTTGVAPLTRTTIAKSLHTIQTPSPQGTSTFSSWSDGGAQQHQVTVGTANVSYTASFTCPVGQYRAEYFNNRTLTGTPLFTACEGAINKNWGKGGPGNGIGNDNFSIRWTGRFTFPAGSRTFTTVSDDGVRLYVDGVLIINRWNDHLAATNTATRTMTAGDHDVKVEYYEHTGGAVIQVSW